MPRRVSPWEPEYCLIMGELNRIHRLELLMVVWLNAAKTSKLQKDLATATMDTTQCWLCDTHMQYEDGNIDLEEAEEDVVHTMARNGARQYWLQRGLLDDYDMLPDLKPRIAKQLCSQYE